MSIEGKIKNSFKLHLNMLLIPLRVNISHPFSKVMLTNVYKNDFWELTEIEVRQNIMHRPDLALSPFPHHLLRVLCGTYVCVQTFLTLPPIKEPEFINMAEYISKCRT